MSNWSSVPLQSTYRLTSIKRLCKWDSHTSLTEGCFHGHILPTDRGRTLRKEYSGAEGMIREHEETLCVPLRHAYYELNSKKLPEKYLSISGKKKPT